MRVGIFQCEVSNLTPDERLDKLATALRYEQLDLVVCPELFMSGYNSEDLLITQAETCGGPFAKRVAEFASANNCAIVYGYPEREKNAGDERDRLYNSAICINQTGQVIANHRKLLLPPGSESRYFEVGTTLTLFDLNGVKCAILICYEAEYPEAVRAVAEAGAQIVIVPTALVDAWKVVAFQMMPTRAIENGVYLLYANHAGSDNGFQYLGGSCIIGPDGKDMARAGAEEEVICADLDFERVTVAQNRLPYLREVQRLRDIIRPSPP